MTEAEVGVYCDDLATKLGWRVERYEQRRATHIQEGLPDRRYKRPGCRLWVELKKPGGQMTEDQYLWLATEVAAGGFATVIDDVLQLAPLLQGLAKQSSIQDQIVRLRCRELIEICHLRGFRPVKGRRKPLAFGPARRP
jgi:hypothetical protein